VTFRFIWFALVVALGWQGGAFAQNAEAQRPVVVVPR